MKLRSRKEDRGVYELEALLKQHRALLDNLLEENERLKMELMQAEYGLKQILRRFYPELYPKASNATLRELVDTLKEALEASRARTRREISGSLEEGVHIMSRRQHSTEPSNIDNLREEEVEALKLVLRGYCTVKSLSEKMRLKYTEASKLLLDLSSKSLIRLTVVRTSSSRRGIKIYFPSELGLKACEHLLGVPWSMLHSEELKSIKMYADNSALAREAAKRLAAAGYKVVTEYEDPEMCSFRWSGGSHRADLAVEVPGRSGEKIVLVECESMSNPLRQVVKMLDAYEEAFGKIFVVVSSLPAKRMMLQRIAYWSWRRGFKGVFEARVEEAGKVYRLGYFPKYLFRERRGCKGEDTGLH